MGKKILHIGLFGLGTVGGGVVKLLSRMKNENNKDYEFILDKVAVKHPKKRRSVAISPHLLTDNPQEILENPKIDIVIEAIGGINQSKKIILQALRNGKNVITANKALLAKEGELIFNEAIRNNCYLGIRASNNAVYRLAENLIFSPFKMKKLIGIFNGTSNYILTQMERKREDFSSALKKAQAIGYAEQNPSDDVDGYDTANKLIVLIGLVFGYFIPAESLFIEGIRKISYKDILFAKELGYKIKLLAIAQRKGEELEVRVHPALLIRDKGIARLNGIENGVEVRDEIGVEVGMQAPGAGKYPTAMAVLEDLVYIANGRKTSFPWQKKQLNLKDMNEIKTEYYLRFNVLDRVGVLAKISGILGNHDISINSVIQKGRGKGLNNAVSIIMLTHKAKERDIQNSLREINNLPIVREKPLLIRVEEGIC
ncbi:homoserine dehydrogenase [Candidatus Aerophobetes bacterium]|nr:homoserine dehydrogenase [Candidatus Aerophobetes bacterium]